MNREEAKYILSAYSVDGDDAGAHEFEEALKMAERDPELNEWFRREQAVDAAIAGKLRGIATPVELKTRLLAEPKIARVQMWGRRRMWLTAAAASLLVVVGLWFRFAAQQPARGFREFHSYVVATAETLDHLDFQSAQINSVREWLRDKRAPDDFVAPPMLEEKPTVGCRVFAWEGKRVSLVCFRISDERVVHMFVIDVGGLKDSPPKNPVFETSAEGITTASWSDAGHVYVVALRDRQEAVRRALL